MHFLERKNRHNLPIQSNTRPFSEIKKAGPKKSCPERRRVDEEA